MKNKIYFDEESISVILTLLIAVYMAGAWLGNFIKFLNCDFEKPYRDEIVHSIGVFIPPASAITVWY